MYGKNIPTDGRPRHFTPQSIHSVLKTFIKKCWGGGNTVQYLPFLLSIVFLLPSRAHAQLESYALDPADGVTVVITPKIYDPNGSNTCGDCCYPITCRRAMYQVHLEITPDVTDAYDEGDFLLLYEQLSLTVEALIDPENISKINKPETDLCIGLSSGSFTTPSFMYGADESNNSATLIISDVFFDETSEEVPTIEFQGYVSQILFTIVVDFFPGEPTGAMHTDFLYVYDDVTIASAAGSSPGAPSTYPEPANLNSNFVISLGTPTCDNDFAVFPVLLTSSITEEIEYLDFSVEVATDVALSAQPDFDNVLSGTTPVFGPPAALPGDGGYAYLVSYTEETLTGTGLTLFEIKVPTPIFLSAGYEINATLKSGRLVIDTDCDKPRLTNAEKECVQDPIPECDPADYTVLIQTELDPLNDCELTLYIYFDWLYSLGSTQTFNAINLLLDFDMPPDVTMTDIYTAYMTNPGDNNCSLLTPSSPGGSTFRFCVESDGGITLTAMNSVIVVVFEAPAGCINDVLVREASLQEENMTEPCIPIISKMAFPYCTPLVQGNIVTEDGCYVEDVLLTVQPDPLPTPPEPICDQHFYTVCGTYSTCVCPAHSDYLVTPSKNNDPLNGVSTYDLVLINRHLLGLDPLGSPYKIIAADVNKSNSITAGGDLLELRKLILGIITVLPGSNTSWRFVPLEHEFPNPANPFTTPLFPETISAETPITDADFVAIKVGDVNGNVTTNCSNCDGPQPRPLAYTLSLPDRAVKAGEYVTIPVVAAGEAPLIAFQLALRFDPLLLEFVGPAAGDIEGINADNFGLSRISEGILRALWMAQPDDDEARLQEGQRLFFLTFRAKRSLDQLDGLLQFDHEILPSMAWTDDGAEYRLQLQAERKGLNRDLSAANSLTAQIRPNPTGGAVSLDFALPEAGAVRLSVYDAFGVRVFYREMQLPPGQQTLELPEAAGWAAGIYSYDLRAGKVRAKGHVVRQ